MSKSSQSQVKVLSALVLTFVPGANVLSRYVMSMFAVVKFDPLLLTDFDLILLNVQHRFPPVVVTMVIISR